MQKTIGVGVVWLVTLGAAWFMGRETAPEPEPTTTIIREAEDPGRDTGPALRGEAPDPEPVRVRPAQPVTRSTQLPTIELDLASVPEDFQLDAEKSLEELSREFMAWVAVQLGRGKAGHLTILDKLDALAADEQFRGLVRNERDLQPLMYGWIRFLVDRDRQVVDLSETVFETMAEKPMRFEKYDDNTLEIFTEGFAYLLPSMVDQDRVAVFRKHAKRVLETPREEQSKAVSSNRGELERVLVWLQPPLTPEQALAKFQAKEYSSEREMQHLVAQMKPEQLKQIDVDAALGPSISSGNYAAFRQLRYFQPQGRDLDRLDQRVVEGVRTGKLQRWHVSTYLRESGRRTFESAKGFVERGLAAGGKTADVYALSIIGYKEVPKDWVVWCVERHDLREQTIRQLKGRFGIQ